MFQNDFTTREGGSEEQIERSIREYLYLHRDYYFDGETINLELLARDFGHTIGISYEPPEWLLRLVKEATNGL